jgi:cytochrome o ubiquinol oxidase subunit II
VFRTIGLTAALALLLAGCSYGVLAPAGPVGRAERLVLLNSLAIMLTIVIPTILATLFFAWRYRASNTRAKYLPDFAYSGRLELIIWSIPSLIILFLGGVIWAGSHDLDPAKPLPSQGGAPLEVQVVSLDWKWLFIYPEQRIASVNELVMPAGRPVHFTLTSGSVMNMFWVPQLGGMIATMNRMTTQISLQADEPGRYDGRSTQFSGDGFSDMQFTARAVSPGEFSEWVGATRRTGPVLDEAAYRALSQQSRNVRPFTYREADPALFHAIVRQTLPPGPGPSDTHGNASVRPDGDH